MSNVFSRQGVRFLALPMFVVEQLADMTEAELRLYVCLLQFADKHTAVELHLPAFIITDYTGMHSETIRIARKKLEMRGYILCKKGFQGVTVYSILNPISKTKLPPPKFGSQQFSGIYKYESNSECGSERARRNEQKERARRNAREAASSPFIPPTGRELFGSGSVQHADQTEPRPSQSVGTSKPMCDGVADPPGFFFREVNENGRVSDAYTPSSEEPLKKEYEEKGSERRRTTSCKAGNMGNAKGEGEEGHAAPAERVAAALAENVTVRRLHEKFAAAIVAVNDCRSGQVIGDVGAAGDLWAEWLAKETDRLNFRKTNRKEHFLLKPENVKTARRLTFVKAETYTPKSKLGQPQKCRTHGATTWWRLPGDTMLICDRCHPNPHDTANWESKICDRGHRGEQKRRVRPVAS